MKSVEQMSSNEILLQIGEELAASKAAALPSEPTEIIRIASEWIDENLEIWSSRICANQKIRELATEHNENHKLALLVSDVITGCTMGVAPLLVSYMLVRKGISRICQHEW